MALNLNDFTNWVNGQSFTAEDYVYERNLIIAYVNTLPTLEDFTGGALDGRYYTETELDAGQLDNRYYTETESDSIFVTQVDFDTNIDQAVKQVSSPTFAQPIVDGVYLQSTVTGHKALAEYDDANNAIAFSGDADETFDYRINQSLRTTDDVIFNSVAFNETNKMSWNNPRGTVDIIFNGYTYRPGHTPIYTTIDVPTTKGSVIMFTGSTGGIPDGTSAVGAITETPEYIIGILANATTGPNEKSHVLYQGVIEGISASAGETWAEGDVLYVSNNTGQLTNVAPTGAEHTVLIAAVTRVINQSNIDILIRPHVDKYHLNELDGMELDTLVDNDLIQWDSTSETWKPLSLFSGGYIDSALLPSYVDDVLEFADFASLPGTGAAGKLYVTLDTNNTYRWSGSAYVSMVGTAGQTPTVTTNFDNKLSGADTDVQKALETLDGHAHVASELSDVYSKTEINSILETGNTTIQEQRYVITNADNGDGTFSYTWNSNPLTGNLTGGVYTFTLQSGLDYVLSQSRLKVYVNNDIRFSYIDSELTELSETTFSLQYAFQNSDDIMVEVFQSIYSADLSVPENSITRTFLAPAVESDIDGKQIKATNSDTATDGQVYTANGDQTFTFETPVVYQKLSTNQAGATLGQVLTAKGGEVFTYEDLPNSGAIVSATAPTGVTEGDLWFDTGDGSMYIYYQSQWVDTDILELEEAPIDGEGYVRKDQAWSKYLFNYTTTILAADTWVDQTGYWTLAKTVTGLLDTDKPTLDPNFSGATVANVAGIQTAWGTIYRAPVTANTITFYALEEPVFPEDTVIDIEVIR